MRRFLFFFFYFLSPPKKQVKCVSLEARRMHVRDRQRPDQTAVDQPPQPTVLQPTNAVAVCIRSCEFSQLCPSGQPGNPAQPIVSWQAPFRSPVARTYTIRTTTGNEATNSHPLRPSPFRRRHWTLVPCAGSMAGLIDRCEAAEGACR